MSNSPEDEMNENGEPKGPKIPASNEMEEALREATEAVDEDGAAVAHEAAAAADDASPDKLTIEMLSAELQDLKSHHEEKSKEFEEQNQQFLRLQAEFENFRRRSLKEKQESLKFGHQNLVKDLLSAVDNLERALEHGAQTAGAEAKGILDGVELVHREVLGAMAKHAVSEIEAEGRPFDPAVHEAMGQIPNGDVTPNTVLKKQQKGYVIHDRMLRPSRVLVARELTPEEGGSATDE
ncbi:MAG: nucleotide exchange factor GrpE [Myxococcota bacterium]